jgi:hypothetical protein
MSDYPFVVMTPYYGNASRSHLKCIRALLELGVPFIPLEDCPYLDVARSHLLTQARKQMPDAQAFMFIDHDMMFDPEDAIGVIMRLIEKNLDVSGAAYSLRKPGLMVAAKPFAEQVTFYQPGHEPAEYVGTGFMAIHRKVVDDLDQVMPEMYCPTVRTDMRPYFERYCRHGIYYPDDVGFCFRVRDRGKLVWIDTEPRIFHRGVYDYALEDAGMSVPNSAGPLTIDFSEPIDTDFPPEDDSTEEVCDVTHSQAGAAE